MGSTADDVVVTTEDLSIEGIVFPPVVKPLGTNNSFFLAGAGVRGLEIEGRFVKFTAIGVYFEDSPTPVASLSENWKGKTAAELSEDEGFYRDVVTGPFEKFIRVTMILPLTGEQYSGKVSENCEKIWKSMGIFTDAEDEALKKFRDVFKDRTFPPGASVLFTQSPAGQLTIAFSEDGSVPEMENGVIENRPLSGAMLESIIGAHGVSPETKLSLAARMAVKLA